ncbi:hypothetical protein CYMTET_51306 [Cymbomonas tetramitiformis]|uniref:Uncharacterized protein n=1 Tax=Cymbomonas tetramitiformis TaxID=36881 RepID=A0AAE0ESA2_9CHLO|nr:hypothetical protein CYMTET_51306 [Cymbomonas tetramitiformis]
MLLASLADSAVISADAGIGAAGLDGDIGSDSPRVLRRDLASLRNEAKSGFRSHQEHLRQQSVDVQCVFDKLDEMASNQSIIEGNIKSKLGHEKNEVHSLKNQVQQLSTTLSMVMAQVTSIQIKSGVSETALATDYRVGNPLAEMHDSDSPPNSTDNSTHGPLRMNSISSALRASSALEFSSIADKRRHMQNTDTPKKDRGKGPRGRSRDDSDSEYDTDGDVVAVAPRPAGNRFTNPPKSKPWYQIEFQGCSSHG